MRLLHIEFLNGAHGMGTYDLFKFGPVSPTDADQKIPGQGGLVDTPDGQWFWMAQFNNSGADGRRATSHGTCPSQSKGFPLSFPSAVMISISALSTPAGNEIINPAPINGR
jgi:hypothetical protein